MLERSQALNSRARQADAMVQDPAFGTFVVDVVVAANYDRVSCAPSRV
jgi:hypothetical protein